MKEAKLIVEGRETFFVYSGNKLYRIARKKEDLSTR